MKKSNFTEQQIAFMKRKLVSVITARRVESRLVALLTTADPSLQASSVGTSGLRSLAEEFANRNS